MTIMKIELPNYTAYMFNGRFHNTEGPAVITDTEKYYYQNGLLHNVGGPAIKTLNSREYWEFGKPHNANGPARLFKDKTICEFWLNGDYVNQSNDPNVFYLHWREGS